MGRERTDPSCAWSPGSKRRQFYNDLEEQMDMRAVMGKDAVDTKHNQLTSARAEKLVRMQQRDQRVRNQRFYDKQLN